MPEKQQDATTAQRITHGRKVRARRLLFILIGLLLVIAGLVLHKNVVAFVGLVFILATSMILGGGT